MGEEIMIQPKVSVVIPIWNTEKYLEKCLNSIVNQTLKDIEIICVNNGSTDSCAEIIERFAKNDDRIKIVTIEHGYLSDARNKGFEYTTGEYLYFCDSDDTLEHSALEELYEYSKNLNADLCILQERRISEKNGESLNIDHRHVRQYGCEENKVCTYKDMKNLFLSRFEAWLHFYKRSFFIDNKLFYPSKTFYEDVIVHFKSLFFAKRIVFYYKPLYNYLLRSSSALAISHSTPEKLDAIVFFKDVYNLLIDLDLLDCYLDEYVSLLCNQMRYHVMTANDKYRKELIKRFKKFVSQRAKLKQKIAKNKEFKRIYNYQKKPSKLKLVLTFLKSYLLFPWYTYKTYKLIEKRYK